MIKKLLNNKYIQKLIVLIFIVLLIVIIGIIYRNILKGKFINEIVNLAEENENVIFKIDKILLYSSAGIDDNYDKTMKDIDICQYTDIAVYIDNKNYIKELTEKNTINELYIDNINITTNSDMGEKDLNYKNPSNFGKYETLESDERIDFNVVHLNKDNVINNYDYPSFYTDCSNPITLGYVNKNIKKYSITKDEDTISYDGKILKAANVNLEDINSNISFTIHVKNNLDEEFIHNTSIDIPLDGIYNGFVAKIKTTFKEPNTFLKLVK